MYTFSKINTLKHGSSAAESGEAVLLKLSLADGTVRPLWAAGNIQGLSQASQTKVLVQFVLLGKKLLLAIFLNIPQFTEVHRT